MKRATHVRRVVTVSAAILFATSLFGCSTVPRAEYRAGLFIHHAPDYSFKMPGGWRRAEPGDAGNVAFNRRVLQRFSDPTRNSVVTSFQNDLRRFDAILISSRGAYLQVEHAANNSGVRFPAGYVLNEREKHGIWTAFSRDYIAAAPEYDKPKLRLDSLSVVDYGRYSALSLRFFSSTQRGDMRLTAIAFTGQKDIVMFAHVGTPEDPDEGIVGLEEVAKSFQFDTESASASADCIYQRDANQPETNPRCWKQCVAEARVSAPGIAGESLCGPKP